MPSLPKSVVIVGGSLAGLMHGIQLKRQGSRVTILEQDLNSERKSHSAGIGFNENVDEYLRRFDATASQVAMYTPGSMLSYRKFTKLYQVRIPRKLTSWSLLYSILRANFDGLASKACPNPPVAEIGDGKVEYRSGKRVTGLEYVNGIVTVNFEDVSNGEHGSIAADLVIGADGIHSTVRKLVQAHCKMEYSGYAAWRATIPEKELSKETLDFFSDGLGMQFLRDSYLVCYTIPTDDGCFDKGERLVNWLWYYNLAEGSPELKDIFTDKSGVYHRNTVPAGRVRSEVWERARASRVSQMAAPYAELVQKTTDPFITRVNDLICTENVFYDGHVILAGDAFASVRPHLALATDHAAWQCLVMGKVWKGEADREETDRELHYRARRTWHTSRVIGFLGQSSWFLLLKAFLSYLSFLVTWRVFKR